MAKLPATAPPHETVEFEPFVPGREVRTFSAVHWDLLVPKLKPVVAVRTRKAARLVLVDKLPYKLAALACGETPAMVRASVYVVMERLGCMGRNWYRHDPERSLILRNVPAEHHARVRKLVAQALRDWREAPPADVVTGADLLDADALWSEGVTQPA